MRYFCLFLTCVALIGCNSGPRVAPVAGRITLDGKALDGASVAFQPIGDLENNPGPGSYSRSDRDGRFVLRLVSTDQEGAVVGRHRVMISTLGGQQVQMSDAGVKLPKDKVPRRYNSATTLTFDVPATGTEEANFVLTSTP